MGSSNFGHFDLNLISINIRRMRDRKFGVDVECVCERERESESQNVWIVVQPIRSFGLFNLKLKALKVPIFFFNKY